MAVNKGGAPVKYKLEDYKGIIARIALGESVLEICREEGQMSHAKFYIGVDELGLVDEYREAQKRRTEIHADMLKEIALNDKDDVFIDEDGKARPNSVKVARDKLKIDTLKWHMSKMNPKKYGDKVQKDITTDGKPINIVFHESLGE